MKETPISCESGSTAKQCDSYYPSPVQMHVGYIGSERSRMYFSDWMHHINGLISKTVKIFILRNIIVIQYKDCTICLKEYQMFSVD